MPAYRSTILKQAEKHCLHVLDHMEAGTPYDREIFAVGIAAHAVLQVAGETLKARGTPADGWDRVADQVVRELVTKGRSFEGEPEPPMSVASASAGRDLALGWLLFNELSPSALYEFGLAVDAGWNPIGYDDARVYYRCALDVIDTAEEGEDEYTAKVVIVTDYKSAWSTTADELDTVQLRGQAAVAVAHHPDAMIVRRRVVNLRTRQIFSADLVLDDVGMETIRGWRRDIDLAIAAAESRRPDGKRPARPGAGCIGCPYVARCEGARALLRGSVLDGDPVLLAQRYAAAKAIAEALGEHLRVLAADEPIRVPGGRVGYVAKEGNAAAPAAMRTLARAWFAVPEDGVAAWDAENGRWLGLLAAFKPGVGALKAAAQALHPSLRGKDKSWKVAREDLLARLLTRVTKSTFGVHPDAPVESETETPDEGEE